MDVCDVVKTTMRHPDPSRVPELADKMQLKGSQHMEAFKLAHGEDPVRLKHHEEVAHLAKQLRADKMLLTCWTMERKHIKAKAAFNHYADAQTMLKGGLARLVNPQVILFSNLNVRHVGSL